MWGLWWKSWRIRQNCLKFTGFVLSPSLARMEHHLYNHKLTCLVDFYLPGLLDQKLAYIPISLLVFKNASSKKNSMIYLFVWYLTLLYFISKMQLAKKMCNRFVSTTYVSGIDVLDRTVRICLFDGNNVSYCQV